ncbi:ribonuclease H-like domain-containing protein [Tanacetum coccineum]
MSLSEYYHECNSLWMQFDSLVDLPACTCEGSTKLKEHAQLLRLMQFLIGLDDMFKSVRSIILTTEPIPDVKSAFATLSRDESNRNSHSTSRSVKAGPSAFAARSNNSNGNSNWNSINSSNNNGNKRFGRVSNLVCKHCNMTGHTIDRCFELSDHSKSTTHTLTSDQYQILMSLLSDACIASTSHASVARASQHIIYCATFLYDIIDVTHLNLTVSRPNETIEQVKQLGNIKLRNNLILKDVLVVPGYKDLTQKSLMGTGSDRGGLYFFDEDQVFVVLKNKVKEITTSGSGPYDVCHKAKRIREPFPISEHKSKSLENGITDNFFNSSHESNEPYDDGRDSADIGNRSAPNEGTNKSRFSTVDGSIRVIDNAQSETSVSESEKVSADVTSSTSSRKDTRTKEYATETSISEDYVYEGEELESFGQLFRWSPEPAAGQTVRRTSRKYVLPSKHNDYVLNKNVKFGIDKVINYAHLSLDNYVFTTSINKIHEPTTYLEAVKDSRWVDAMNQEMEALNRNGTWEIARLVAKGFNQNEGIDYEETFSPVVKIVVVRCILSIAVNNKWPLYQLDINNVFLYGDLEEDVYMNLPEGYSDKGDKRVCKLIKSFYGLKQAPRKWNEKLVFVLNENGFKQSMNDFSLFVKRNKDIVLVLLVYMDDIIMTGNDLNVDNGICLTQRKYCTELLTKFGMLACKPCNTSIEANLENKKVISKFGDDEPLTGYAQSYEVSFEACFQVEMNYDNSYAIQIFANPVLHERSKHFEIDLYFLREKVVAGFIKPMKVKTEENIADLITKGLCVFDHNRLSPKHMGLVDNQAKSELKVFSCLKKED